MSPTLQPYFHSERAAHSKLEQIVWPLGPVCPHCGARDRIGSVIGKSARVALKFCCHCRKQFRATIRTTFEGTHVPLHKWFRACFLRYCCEYLINARQLHLTLGVTYKTSLYLMRTLDDLEHVSSEEVFSRPRVSPEISRAYCRSIRSAFEPSTEIEEQVPWVLPTRIGPSQFAAFVEVARRLRPIGDAEHFDRILARIANPQRGPTRQPPVRRHNRLLS